MLSEILFLLLVVAVAVLMAVDVARTRSESQHGYAERQPFGAERAVATVPSVGLAATTFSPEPATAMPAVPAPAAGQSPRETEATRAFDQMHREMSQSAAGEAAFRGKFNATYLNLSRRSQALVERQIRLIESLEHGEQDQQRLASLSKLNRIAMRMHRNSQNLLVLAGQEPATDWNQPVTLVHLVEAALAEIEDYERVSVEVQPDIAVRGPAVHDAVHLLVELIDNATSFSAAEMPVHVTGRILTSGGALVDITDRGIGMPAKEMAYANHQLDNPPAPEIDVPKWMGLLVVARLAARHGIRVRLNATDIGGLTALVWFPDGILTHHAAPANPGLSVAEPRAAAAGTAASAPARTNMPAAAAARPDPAWSARGPQVTVPAQPLAAARLADSGRPGAPDGGVGVLLPQAAESQARTSGPPIFDEVESFWSKGGREAPSPHGPVTAPGSVPVPGPIAAPGPAAAASPAAAVGPAAAASPAAAPGAGAAAGPAASGLPRRPSPVSAGPRTMPGTPPGTPNRPGAMPSGRSGFQRAGQGRAGSADEAKPGGPEES
jgi:hypothetical protein